MKSKEKKSGRNRLFGSTLPLLLVIFMAIASVVYIMFKNWSNKTYAKKWKDYDECGI